MGYVAILLRIGVTELQFMPFNFTNAYIYLNTTSCVIQNLIYENGM